MKHLQFVVLGVSGLALLIVALRAPKPDYVAPTAAEIEAHRPAPRSLSAPVGPDRVVRTIRVRGMCCAGCTGAIYDRLKETPGFVDAAVDLDEGVAQVVMSKDADPAPFVGALHFEKFDASLER
jgi:copper chaperone CopZ